MVETLPREVVWGWGEAKAIGDLREGEVVHLQIELLTTLTLTDLHYIIVCSCNQAPFHVAICIWLWERLKRKEKITDIS